MPANFEKQLPESANLAAAMSGFGLIEGAFLPVSRLIGPASLWSIAVASLTALAVAGAVTAAQGVSPSARIEAAGSVNVSPIVSASSTSEETPPGLNLPLQTVVLRRKPPSKAGRPL